MNGRTKNILGKGLKLLWKVAVTSASVAAVTNPITIVPGITGIASVLSSLVKDRNLPRIAKEVLDISSCNIDYAENDARKNHDVW